MADSGALAGELYHALSARGISASRVNYEGRGGWKMRLVRRGGMIRGQPRVEFDPGRGEVVALERRLWGTRRLGAKRLEEAGSGEELAGWVVGVFWAGRG